MPTRYTIAIATRNRCDALKLSLPRMLNQTIPPAQLIIADSSDDHASVRTLVDEIAAAHRFPIRLIQCGKGLTFQRNVALREVTQAITFFPDDDSIFFPDTAEQILRIYDSKPGATASAVCGLEAQRPPDDFPQGTQLAYKKNLKDHILTRFGWLRTRIENRLFPDPVRLLVKAYMKKEAWENTPDTTAVDWMTGFRMTFRTAAITKGGFDETLREYALYEDREASMDAWRHGAVVCARKALIYHHRSPEKRENGRRFGATSLLNLAYIVGKRTQPNSPERRALLRFCRYKYFLYSISARDGYARARREGAQAALGHLQTLLSCSPETLSTQYASSLQACLSKS